jgi:hypothetical protein
MAYRKPNAFTRRVFNPIAMRFGVSGTKTLAVPRRRSGGVQRVPVIPLEHGGHRYLVSPRGEAQWVRNLRAAEGQVELTGKQGSERLVATEVPVPERKPLLDAYRDVAGRAVAGHFAALPDAADHPVFRLERP